MECTVCGRFRREADKASSSVGRREKSHFASKRHKCKSETEKPIQDQKGAVQCRKCKRWVKSRGGLSVHKCILTQGDNPN